MQKRWRAALIARGVLTAVVLLGTWSCASLEPVVEMSEVRNASSSMTPREQVLVDSCSHGDLDACARLAMAYYEGDFGERQVELAREILDVACAGGEARGCTTLGVLIEEGGGEESRATEVFERGCELEEPFSCYALGERYRVGLGAPRYPVQAVTYFERACYLGFGPSCYAAGRMRAVGEEVDVDLPRAAVFFDLGCAAREANACAALGLLVELGKGVAKDAQVSIDLYGRSCELGHAEACVHAGRRLRKGEGVLSNPVRAVPWLSLGCASGLAEACTELGYALSVDGAHPAEQRRAAEAFDFACAHRQADACTALGIAYVDGVGVKVSPAHAAALFTRACGLVDGESCISAGVRGARTSPGALGGDGVLELLSRTCEAGLASSCRHQAELASEMGDEGLALTSRLRACTLGDERACADLR